MEDQFGFDIRSRNQVLGATKILLRNNIAFAQKDICAIEALNVHFNAVSASEVVRSSNSNSYTISRFSDENGKV